LAGTISSELRQAIREHIPNVPSDSRIFEAADISVGVFSDWGLEADKLSHVTVDLDISTVGDVKSNFVVRLLKIAADKARLAQVDLVNRIARDLQEKTRLFEKSIMVGFKGLLNLMKGANVRNKDSPFRYFTDKILMHPAIFIYSTRDLREDKH
jgi:hypothetical protein